MKKIIYVFVLFSFLRGVNTFPNSNPIEYLEPLPGAVFVNPGTGIIIRPFSKLSAGILNKKNLISVNASKSGVHKGKIIETSNGREILFQPFNPFELTDTVSVVLDASLTDNSKPYKYQFFIKKEEFKNFTFTFHPE